MELSIVSPIYKGEKILSELIRRISESVEKITNSYEIILVNDCSPDNSWERIKEECSNNNHIVGINLSRNFGQHYAITAGLSESQGTWIVVLDCDLQDQPEEIPNLYSKAQEGYDTVFAMRTDRKDSQMKKIQSILFHSTYSYMTGIHYDKSVANFGIFNRKVINAVLSMGDSIKSFGPMVDWVGFKKTYLPVKHAARLQGKSSFNLIKLIRQASDGIIGFSNKPLYMVLQIGFLISFSAFVIAMFYFFRYLMGGVTVDGFTTLVISLWLIGGVVIGVIGVLGIYIAKIFDRVKQRPSYIISEKIYGKKKE